MFVLWLFGAQVLRYVLAAMPALRSRSRRRVRQSSGDREPRASSAALLLGAAAACALVVIAWFAELNPLAAVLGGEARERFLARRLDYYPYYETISTGVSRRDARVWLVNTRRDTYHLERPYFADYLFGAYDPHPVGARHRRCRRASSPRPSPGDHALSWSATTPC